MNARPRISRNEWKMAEIVVSKVGNFALFSCQVRDSGVLRRLRGPPRAGGGDGLRHGPRRRRLPEDLRRAEPVESGGPGAAESAGITAGLAVWD